MTDAEKINQLAASVTGLGGETAHAAAQGSVLLCAVAALVQSHPDQAAFAAAFRRAWQLLGSPNATHPSVDAIDQQIQSGFDDTLAIVEQACAVALNVRPPHLAEPPRSLD